MVVGIAATTVVESSLALYLSGLRILDMCQSCYQKGRWLQAQAQGLSQTQQLRWHLSLSWIFPLVLEELEHPEGQCELVQPPGWALLAVALDVGPALSLLLLVDLVWA